MEVNELRIGNWYIGNDEKKTQWKLEDFSLLTDLDGERPLRIDEIVKSPIPLTEEWLLKFGWVWNEECKSYEGKDIRMNLKYESVSNSYTMFNYVIKAMICKRIWYVHQLQNIFHALTGEELKIKYENTIQNPNT